MRLGKGHRWGDNAGGHDAHPTYTSLGGMSVDHLDFMKYELFWAWTAWST